MNSYIKYKNEAIALRRTGKTYTEIQAIIKTKIPQSTLSDWFKHAVFSSEEKERIAANASERIRCGHFKSIVIKKVKRKIYFEEIQTRLAPLAQLLSNPDIAKIALLMLYWCEGGKNQHGSTMFGNSDPRMISLFLSLMRRCYSLDETKFRATVQL